jgi:hypothetical protein
MNLDSSALELARTHGRDVVEQLPVLRTAAERDAHDLVQRGRSEREQIDGDVVLEAPACIDIATHTLVAGLAEAIYQHALLHAGLVMQHGSGEPYGVCPLCGDDLPRAAP